MFQHFLDSAFLIFNSCITTSCGYKRYEILEQTFKVFRYCQNLGSKNGEDRINSNKVFENISIFMLFCIIYIKDEYLTY